MSHSTTNRTIPPDRDAIARRLSWAHRTILALFDIDPRLGRQLERPRLRLLFSAVLPGTPVEKSFEAINDLHHMHLRGVPIQAFVDWDAPKAGVDTARHRLKDLRHAFGSALPDPALEDDALDHLLRLLGYTILPPACREASR